MSGGTGALPPIAARAARDGTDAVCGRWPAPGQPPEERGSSAGPASHWHTPRWTEPNSGQRSS
jgi:hypothetical protein